MTVFRPAEAQPVEMQDLVSFEFHDHVGVSALVLQGSIHGTCVFVVAVSFMLELVLFCTVLGSGARIESLALRI